MEFLLKKTFFLKYLNNSYMDLFQKKNLFFHLSRKFIKIFCSAVQAQKRHIIKIHLQRSINILWEVLRKTSKKAFLVILDSQEICTKFVIYIFPLKIFFLFYDNKKISWSNYVSYFHCSLVSYPRISSTYCFLFRFYYSNAIYSTLIFQKRNTESVFCSPIHRKRKLSNSFIDLITQLCICTCILI